MRLGVRLVALALCTSAVPAWADDHFRLVTVSGATTRVLDITKTATLDGAVYGGTLTVNSIQATVSAEINAVTQTVTFAGAYSGQLNIAVPTDGVGYAGIVNMRFVGVDANSSSKKIVYDGRASEFDDLAGKSDNDKLTLFWGKSKLTLVPGITARSCSGDVKTNGDITATVSCETDGDLTDGFFTNPEMVILWLINELVN